jgi:CubicO group peptidase (beta-lactamase class C family)
MRKAILGIVIIAGVVVAGLAAIPGVSIGNLGETLRVATGLGAKLGCSARYITGLDEPRVLSDLSSYSPALAYLTVTNDDQAGRTFARLFGFFETSARYRENIGCTLDIGDTSPLDRIQPARITRTGAPWPRGSGVETIDPAAQDRLAEMLAGDNEEGLETRALLVVRDGEVVAESYAPGFGPATPLLGWSMAKSLTAILIGILELEGRLSVDETAVFSNWQDGRQAVSIEHLLQMSSGLDFNEDYVPGSDATRMLFLEPGASAYALTSPLAHPPGTHFSYSSGTANLLARIVVERTGGTDRAMEFLRASLLEPLVMTDTFFEIDPEGVFVGSSYAYASARDWARLGQLMLNGGTLNGHRVVSTDWVDRAQSPNSSSNDPRYGYQFWLNGGGSQPRWPGLPPDAYAMNGNRAQTVMIIPSRNLVIVRLGWTSGFYSVNDRFSEIAAWF